MAVVAVVRRPRGLEVGHVWRLWPSSERLADQVTTTGASTAWRITTSCAGIEAGHSRLLQMWSLPDVMVTVIVSADACQVHASVTTVRRLIVIGMSAPPGADVIAGVATMSDGVQGPVGSARTGSGGAVSCSRLFFLFLLPLPVVVTAVGPVVGAAVVSSTAAPAWVASPEVASLPSDEPPRSRASTITRTSGMPITTRRRVQ